MTSWYGNAFPYPFPILSLLLAWTSSWTTIDLPVIWNATTFVQRHCNVKNCCVLCHNLTGFNWGLVCQKQASMGLLPDTQNCGWHAPGMPGTFSPSPQVSDPDMHHGTCVTHVPWCMPGSLTSGLLWNRRRGKTFPAFLAHAQTAILRIW